MSPDEIFALPVHPAAALFPMLDEAPAAELAEDVKAQGLLDPIVIWQGFLLDGRNRRAACLAAGVDPRVEEFTGEDPVSYIISKNVHRRHLKLGERALVAAELARMGRGRPAAKPEVAAQGPLFDESAENPQFCGISATEAAEKLGVSARSVESARAVLDRGTPALKEAVKSGAVPVSTGEKVARLPAEEQDELVSAGDERIRERAKSLAKGVPDPEPEAPAAEIGFEAAAEDAVLVRALLLRSGGRVILSGEDVATAKAYGLKITPLSGLGLQLETVK